MQIQNLTNTLSSPPTLDKSAEVKDVSLATVKPSTVKEPTAQDLQSAVDKLNKNIKENHTNLDISVDSNTKELVVKVVDSSNGDVITQFPSKVAIAIANNIDRVQKGILLNNQA
jgi:flagellar protein FlaG